LFSCVRCQLQGAFTGIWRRCQPGTPGACWLAGLAWPSRNPADGKNYKSPDLTPLVFLRFVKKGRCDLKKKKKEIPHPNNRFADCLFQLLSFWEGRGSKQRAKVPSDAIVLFQHVILPFDETILLVLWQNNFNDRHS